MLQDMIQTPEQISIHDCISSPLTDEIFGLYDEGFFEDTVDSPKISSPTANTVRAISTATTPAATATITCASMDVAADLSCYDHNFTSTLSPFDSSLILSGLLDSQPLSDPKPNIQQPNHISASRPLSTLHMNSTYTQCSTNQLDQMTHPLSVLPTTPTYSTNQLDEMIATGFTPYPSVPTVSQHPLTLAGYMGLDTPSLVPSLFLDAGDFYASRAGMPAYGDGKMGFFGNGNRATEACDAMIYAHGSMQELYGSGDLQALREGQYLAGRCGGSSNSLSPTSDISRLDDSTYKVGRLTMEERREKIHRYMKKRNERNFSKKIKYACRKTLADSRPRVRGRFAKNDEFGEAAPRRSCSAHHDYDEEYDGDEIMVKHGEDILESLDIQSHISGANSFNYNYTVESWI